MPRPLFAGNSPFSTRTLSLLTGDKEGFRCNSGSSCDEAFVCDSDSFGSGSDTFCGGAGAGAGFGAGQRWVIE